MLLCAVQVRGGCLTDSDTSHSTQDYAQRLYKYTSKQPVQPSSSSELKFMTFNQQSGFHTNCVNNVTAQAAFIRSVDYVGTQETVQGVDTRCNKCSIPSIIADVAGMATRFVMAIPWRTGQYGTSIGTSQTILDTKYELLTYAGFETRAVVAVKTQPQALQGRYLWFINVHVEYYSLIVRQAQITQIHAFVQSQILAFDSQAVIVMVGDFNGGPWDPVYSTMKLASYKNAWEEFKGTIFEGNTIPAGWPGSRFDHIWFRAPAGVYISVKHAEVPNVLMSDHRPFIATLAFSFAESISTDSVVCVGPIFENVPVTIKCPSVSQKIHSVQFASYGNPSGTCQSFKLGNCIGGSSTAVVKDKCLNRNSCTFPIANNVFGDPCPGTGKHFLAQVLCKVY
jgi:endonuclease/exonuclease/phosphatase family metal-dependent hydrolase